MSAEDVAVSSSLVAGDEAAAAVEETAAAAEAAAVAVAVESEQGHQSVCDASQLPCVLLCWYLGVVDY